MGVRAEEDECAIAEAAPGPARGRDRQRPRSSTRELARASGRRRSPAPDYTASVDRCIELVHAVPARLGLACRAGTPPACCPTPPCMARRASGRRLGADGAARPASGRSARAMRRGSRRTRPLERRACQQSRRTPRRSAPYAGARTRAAPRRCAAEPEVDREHGDEAGRQRAGCPAVAAGEQPGPAGQRRQDADAELRASRRGRAASASPQWMPPRKERITAP